MNGSADHSRAFMAAQAALDDADKEKRAAQRNVERFQEELETARTILAVAQSVYDEKYTMLLSLEECEEHDTGHPVATNNEANKYPPAARRLSASNPYAANRLKSLRIDDSVSRRSSLTTRSSYGSTHHQQSLSVEDAARIVAEEDAREEWKRTHLDTIRSERELQWDDDGSYDLDRSHHERIQMFNQSMTIGGMKSLSMVASSSSCCGSNLSRPIRWLSSFRGLDPRYQIYNFFEDVAQEGVDNIISNKSFQQPALLKLLSRASAFSVWRPTSMAAIRKMMSGEATGKGLEIKGKSAKKGMLSSLVPFVQIYEEQHKERIRECVRDKTMRVFFPTEKARDEAAEMLNDVVEMMMFFVQDAMQMLANPEITEEQEKEVMKHLQWDGSDLGCVKLNDYAPNCYGVQISERLFWEGFVMMQDCSRPPGSKFETGRPSEPAFMDMNFKAVRHVPSEPGEPTPVVYQADAEYPMSPRTLVVAYEEKTGDTGRVLPVVSDFDCFTVGTRGVKFDQPLPPDQIELVKWTVTNIESVLDQPFSADTWTKRWLEILKQAAIKGFYPKMPRFGFGDPKSYALMGKAVESLQDTGAVRHGAECFNYFFPQDLDDEFLVVSDTLPGGVPWKYVGVEELQKILIHKINDGHTFPLNPKWVLCDPGWKKVYDKLMASDRRNVQESLNVWFPPESGIREHIERVYAKHPSGFARLKGAEDSRDAMEFAELELERFVNREMGKRKIRAVVAMIALANSLPSAKANYSCSYRPPPPQSPERMLSRQVARARASIVVQRPPPQAAAAHAAAAGSYGRGDSGDQVAQTAYLSAPPPRASNSDGRRGRSRRNLNLY
mmetsp:Transcript_6824/g.16242  ORF Transcript_6824/g.16242 Transcript_6824/m.16242 type:complete len:837 (-) Transcript_6824:27-2537(-)